MTSTSGSNIETEGADSQSPASLADTAALGTRSIGFAFLLLVLNQTIQDLVRVPSPQRPILNRM